MNIRSGFLLPASCVLIQTDQSICPVSRRLDSEADSRVLCVLPFDSQRGSCGHTPGGGAE